MRIFIVALVSIACFKSLAQDINLTGTWVGNATYMKSQSEIRYELVQNGDQLSGTYTSIRGDDKVKASVKGRIQKNVLTLYPYKIIETTGLACAAKAELRFSMQDHTEMLTGQWKGDMKMITCAPLLSGNIMIVKERPDGTPEVLNRNLKIQDIGEHDAIGQTLMAELGSRKYYALIIGIDEYDHSEIIDLDHPVNDSKLLVEVLTEYYSFEVSDLTILHNPTRAEIIEALDMLAGQVSEKDNLLVFYAGHGIWNAQLNQGYWLPSDAAPDVKSNWLSNSTIRDYIGGIRSKHTLLIADACFSGGILKERALFANSKAILEMYKLPSRKALTSGTLNTVPDKSVFMQYLLKNLKENTEPLLSADQLFRKFKTAVINNSPNGQVPQYGPISQAGDEGGDFIFLKRTF